MELKYSSDALIMLDFIGSRDILPPPLPLCMPVVPCFLSPADSGGTAEGQGEGEGASPSAAGGSRERGRGGGEGGGGAGSV